MFSTETLHKWYKPAGLAKPASGKLCNKFYNLSKKIKPALIKYKRKQESQSTSAASETATDYLNEMTNTSLDDHEKIKDLWKKTFNIRDANGDIADYFMRYPQLRTPIGPTLV